MFVKYIMGFELIAGGNHKFDIILLVVHFLQFYQRKCFSVSTQIVMPCDLKSYCVASALFFQMNNFENNYRIIYRRLDISLK